jgi:hypothetical protein
MSDRAQRRLRRDLVLRYSGLKQTVARPGWMPGQATAAGPDRGRTDTSGVRER